MKSLDEAAANHVIERNEETDGFRFSHELVRDALLSAIHGSDRDLLHAKIGTMLEPLYTQDIETHAAEILHQYVRATGMIEPGRIARIALLAGKRAAALFECDSALEYLDAGLEAVADADMNETKAWLLLFHGVVPRSDEVERKCLAEADIEDILTALRYFEQNSDANKEEAIDGTLFSLSCTWDTFMWIKRRMLRTDGIRSEKWRGRISADLARSLDRGRRYM